MSYRSHIQEVNRIQRNFSNSVKIKGSSLLSLIAIFTSAVIPRETIADTKTWLKSSHLSITIESKTFRKIMQTDVLHTPRSTHDLTFLFIVNFTLVNNYSNLKTQLFMKTYVSHIFLENILLLSDCKVLLIFLPTTPPPHAQKNLAEECDLMLIVQIT